VDPIGKTDLAQGRVTLRDPDAEADFSAPPMPSELQLRHRFAHLDCHLHRAFSGVGAGQGIIEEHHDAVARELIERAFPASDDRPERGVELA